METGKSPEHRHLRPHRLGQDHADRAHPLLHRAHPRDPRGARARTASAPRWTRWSSSASAASPSSRPRPTVEWRRLPHQHHRHPRPRRLHHRGRALAARARRRDPGALRASPACSRSRSPSTARCSATRSRASRSSTSRPHRREPVPRRATSCARSSATTPVMIQIPIGLEDKLEGVVDLVEMKALLLRRRQRRADRSEDEIPAEPRRAGARRRARRCSTPSRCSPTSSPRRCSRSKVTAELIRKAIRARHASRSSCTPVMLGSAYKNKGVQLLLDGVVRLPARARARS